MNVSRTSGSKNPRAIYTNSEPFKRPGKSRKKVRSPISKTGRRQSGARAESPNWKIASQQRSKKGKENIDSSSIISKPRSNSQSIKRSKKNLASRPRSASNRMKESRTNRVRHKKQVKEETKLDTVVCPMCKKNNKKWQRLEGTLKLKNLREQEVLSALEKAKNEIEELRYIREETFSLGHQGFRLSQAVRGFHHCTRADDNKLDEENSKSLSEGKDDWKSKNNGIHNITNDDVSSQYWDPETIVMSELNLASADIEELKKEVERQKIINRQHQKRFMEAEVNCGLAQSRVSKLEKATRALQLETAEIASELAFAKLGSVRGIVTNDASGETEDDYKTINKKRLLAAARSGDLIAVTVLIDRFGDGTQNSSSEKLIDCRNHDNWTPLMLASSGGHVSVMAKLLDASADPSLKESDMGYTALHLAAWNNRPEAVRYLVNDVGCEVDCEGENWRTPLMLAANWEAADAVKVLLELNADPDRQDIRGKTPIELARNKNISSILSKARCEQEKKVDFDDVSHASLIYLHQSAGIRSTRTSISSDSGTQSMYLANIEPF